MNRIVLLFVAVAMTLSAGAQTHIVISPSGNVEIDKNIYGQFAEHLGGCVYGGLWVGEDSPIPNTDGYRNDVLQAIRDLKVPVMRWPGGCFADEYHWMDGIGPKEKRPGIVNNNWGGTVEDNSFGTHEFLNLCELVGCEPYISGNVGSGSVEELAKWVEYMTCPDGSPMAHLRAQNGRKEPWKVKYLGVGNESWGCGGNMPPEYYSVLYRRYQTYCRNFGDNALFKIASGASDYDYNWTEVLMKNAAYHMNGLSLHYYCVEDWDHKGSATDFTEAQYYRTLGKALEIEPVIEKHLGIMDKYDPEHKVALMVDEWGTWWTEEPGGVLFQQNTMRDALVASLTLDVFHRHADRVKMANIAQFANVLQAMVLTKGDKMVLTPTYHVFEMYKVHQGATLLPLQLDCERRDVDGGRNIPLVSATASRDAAGKVHISLSNVDLHSMQEISIEGLPASKVSGRILTATSPQECNDFDAPSRVHPTAFKDASFHGSTLKVKLPPMSIVTLEL